MICKFYKTEFNALVSGGFFNVLLFPRLIGILVTCFLRGVNSGDINPRLKTYEPGNKKVGHLQKIPRKHCYSITGSQYPGILLCLQGPGFIYFPIPVPDPNTHVETSTKNVLECVQVTTGRLGSSGAFKKMDQKMFAASLPI